jgi:hypothetical protein
MKAQDLFGIMVMAKSTGRGFVVQAGAGRVVLLALVALALPLGPSALLADVIVLRGGGQVQGKIVPDPQNKDRVQVWLLQGRKPLSFQKQQILEVIKRQSPLDEYVVKRGKAAETAQAQYELGAWCEQNKLTDLARLHYEKALAIDKSFEPAHRKLGHVYHGGYWLTRDELSAVQGLVKYKGRWVPKEEKAKRELEAEATATQTAWLRRIKVLRQAFVNGPADRRREAETQFMAIRDPDAVGPLVRVLGADLAPQRTLLAHVLSLIAGPASTAALVKQLLAESDAEVRALVFEKLKERDEPDIVPRLVRALTSNNILVLNRAAWALGNLGAVEAVPKLIPVLVTTESRLCVVSPDMLNQASGGALGPAGPPPVPVAINQSGMAVLTGPVVGQGVVAYGVMSAPWYAMPPNLALDVGGQIDRRPDVRLVNFTYRNTEVLAALEKLTGQDLGYDVDSWRHWVSRSFDPARKATRRVPQP